MRTLYPGGIRRSLPVRPLHNLRVLLLLFAFFLSGLAASYAETSPLVTMIELKGNRKISDSTVYSKIKTREGNPFSKDMVREDIKTLYSIGYFDDVQVEIETFEGGVKLIFNFIEKPVITSLDFQGNKEFKTEKLREKITIASGAVANLPLIKDNAAKVVSFYQSEGYWLVKVIPLIRDISEDAVALTYQIQEGPKVIIKDIAIEGNNAVKDKEIRKVMKTKKRWIFSFLTGSGIYRKEQVAVDLELIRELYNSRGYIYAAISEPEIKLSDDREKLFMKLYISEGEQYKVGTVDIKGNTVFSTGELFGHITFSTGQIFNRSALRSDIDKIIDLYMEKGYARADINPQISVNNQEKTANITLSINEGNIFSIGRIDISGNTKTRDKVIRREMRLDEGDTYNKKLLKRSYQRINNLNYFESVNIKSFPRVDENLIDMDIEVKEKLTGMLSIGGGYSSVDKFMFMGEITQSNLFGKGLHLRLKTELSARRANYNITLQDPWFRDKPISASVSLYNESYEFLDYNKEAIGGSVGFGKDLSEYVGGKISYNLERVKMTDISDQASTFISEQEGTKVTSSISPSIWKDTRDNYLDPSTGTRHALYTTVAGLGGDNYFYKALADSVWYWPGLWKTTLSLRGRAGYANGFAGKELPLYERFYVGGINTIRGLGFGEGGPRNDKGEKIGGNWEAILNAEMIFPLIEDIRLKGVVFYDYGGSFDESDLFSMNDLRKTAGLGFRWLSPFGPIRLEWGYNLDPREEESTSKLEFSMGGVF